MLSVKEQRREGRSSVNMRGDGAGETIKGGFSSTLASSRYLTGATGGAAGREDRAFKKSDTLILSAMQIVKHY
eukprot:2000410-Pleurochrysis_carterae.AAC.1